MSKKLYVGNLPWSATDDTLRQHFAQYGELEDVIVMKDKFSGRSKGFGFVTYKEEADAQKAVDALNGQEMDGRKLNIDFARPPKERSDRF